jgi:hypothetical protein
MIPAGVKVFLASHPIDFRKGPDSLLALVRDAGSDPFNGSLYVFRAKRADRVKPALTSSRLSSAMLTSFPCVAFLVNHRGRAVEPRRSRPVRAPAAR